jgi:hypothetical protein
MVLGPVADMASLLDLHCRRVIGWAASQPQETRSGDPGIENGHRPAITAAGPRLPRADAAANTVRMTTGRSRANMACKRR